MPPTASADASRAFTKCYAARDCWPDGGASIRRKICRRGRWKRSIACTALTLTSTMTTSRAVFCSLLVLAGCSRPASSVRLAVGGQAALRFFPVYLARELGLFEQQGLQVEIADLSGSVKAMQALMGGSADVAAGFYDQTIQMAGEGRRVRSFVTLTRYPGFVAAVAPGSQRTIARIEDLKGAVVGVAAPGSSGHLLLNYLLVSRNLTPSDSSVYSIGTGASAVAAMQRGTVDAGV